VISAEVDGDRGAQNLARMLGGLRSQEDLNQGEQLILDAGGRVSLQGSLLTSTNRLRSLFFQLFLEISEHLEKLTFGGASCFRLINFHSGIVVGEESFRRLLRCEHLRGEESGRLPCPHRPLICLWRAQQQWFWTCSSWKEPSLILTNLFKESLSIGEL